MFFNCVCCVLFRYRPLRRADHSFGGVLPGACVCDLETSKIKRARPILGCCAAEKEKEQSYFLFLEV
jgi:hypothetical protein